MKINNKERYDAVIKNNRMKKFKFRENKVLPKICTFFKTIVPLYLFTKRNNLSVYDNISFENFNVLIMEGDVTQISPSSRFVSERSFSIAARVFGPIVEEDSVQKL